MRVIKFETLRPSTGHNVAKTPVTPNISTLNKTCTCILAVINSCFYIFCAETKTLAFVLKSWSAKKLHECVKL